VCCPQGKTCCDDPKLAGFCADLKHDDNDCGQCGNKCPPGEVCSAGDCQNLCENVGPGFTTCRQSSGKLDCCDSTEVCDPDLGRCTAACPPNYKLCRPPLGGESCCKPNELCGEFGCMTCPAPGFTPCFHKARRTWCCLQNRSECCCNTDGPFGAFGGSACVCLNDLPGATAVCCGNVVCDADYTVCTPDGHCKPI
jgi:hypothetical protein